MVKKKSTKKSVEDKNQEDTLIDMSNAAVKKMLKVEDLEFTFNDEDKNYELWLKVILDRKKLPKPLQVNYFDRTWYMSSEKIIQKLRKIQ